MPWLCFRPFFSKFVDLTQQLHPVVLRSHRHALDTITGSLVARKVGYLNLLTLVLDQKEDIWESLISDNPALALSGETYRPRVVHLAECRAFVLWRGMLGLRPLNQRLGSLLHFLCPEVGELRDFCHPSDIASLCWRVRQTSLVPEKELPASVRLANLGLLLDPHTFCVPPFDVLDHSRFKLVKNLAERTAANAVQVECWHFQVVQKQDRIA